MNIKRRHTFRIGALLLLAVALLGVGLAQSYLALAAPGPSPAVAPRAATLPDTTCTPTGVGTRTCDLWATTGTLSLPGASVPIWGYADTDSGAATLPGPVLIATQGETVTVNLTNNLGEASALLFQGQAMVPDRVGAAANGGTTTYTFVASNPGTYLYEAGLLPNAQHQVAMGMFGALIVRPAAPNQAYADAATAYDDEALLVLSEIDPALNNSTNPSGFDMRDYDPKYYLINGKAYPNTDPIPTSAGNKVLLRYVNAGIQYHSMALLGMHQTVIANDGSPFQYSHRMVAETIGPGQTADVIATAPAASAPAQYALYDGNLLLHNSNSPGFGGMLTFLSASPAGGGTGSGPTTSNVALAPNPTNGSVDVTVTATVTSTTPYTVTAAEFFIDSPGTAGNGTAMTAVDGTFDTANEAVTGNILAATLAALPGGSHTIYVHGQDSASAWGPFASATLTLDKAGPSTGPVALTPNPTNGSVDVAIDATISDATGTVTAAEFFIDTQGAAGTGTAMTASDGAFDTASEAASGTITVADLDGLSAGNHTIYVHGQNSAGNWGEFNFAVLNLDKAGPATSGLTLTPDPSNGSVDVALNATGDDQATGNSNVTAAEYTIDGGVAVTMTVNVAAPVASLSATIPAATINALSEGTHVVSVRSQDALDNWGAVATITLTLDQTGPATSGVSATPNPTNAVIGFNSTTPAVRVSASFTDTLSNVSAAEGFIDTAGADGTGFIFLPSDGSFNSPSETGYADVPLTTIVQLSEGEHTIYVHGKDAAGNWGATSSEILVVDKTAPTITGVSLTPDTIAFGTASVTLNVAADGTGSGVSGGEYWIDGTATPPANATAFTDTSPAIDTSALAGGVHTVYVRVQDAAGNWSTVSSATLTVVQAVDDALTITANTQASQQVDIAAPGLLANDEPIGDAGRTAALATDPVRIDATGNLGTITVTCPPSSTSGVCADGSYRITLNADPGAQGGNARRASKRGTYEFTYTETLNGVPSTATVTITVN
jgi:hypothetical protein